MEMMRITKNVEEELKDEDNDGKRRGVRKGIVGHSDWAVLLKSRSGSNQNQTPDRLNRVDLTRITKRVRVVIPQQH
jgi:hypothetical protein